MWVSLAAAALLAAAPAPEAKGPPEETRISIDVKDVSIIDMVRLLSELAGFQVVIDGGVSCSLTLKLTDVPWPKVLDTALRSCRLGHEEDNGIVRIASVARLTQEAAERRKLAEEKRLSGPLRVTRYPLSYARARDLAPTLKKFLSPRGEILVDERTNTLIVMDVD
jgi:type IV pilus assembly protein PilQ